MIKTIKTPGILVVMLLFLIAAMSVAFCESNPAELIKFARDAARMATRGDIDPAEASSYFKESINNYREILSKHEGSEEAKWVLEELAVVQGEYIKLLEADNAKPTAEAAPEQEKTEGAAVGLLAQARAAVEKTQQPGLSTTDLNDSYKTAIDSYNKLIKKDWTVDSAVARIELSQLLADANPKHQNLEQAYKTLRQLQSKYDMPADELAANISQQRSLSSEQAADEANQILFFVEKAKNDKEKVLEKWNVINSTKTQYKIMDFFVGLTGHRPSFSYWIAIVLITIIVRVAITPLTKAQFKSMKEMQKVAPLIKEVQTKHKGDQKAIGEKTMQIYKEHKISPFASCLPLLVQMPILMGLFYTIKSYEPQFVKGHFLWIGSTAKHIAELPVPAFFNTGDKVFLPAMNLSEPDLILVLLYVVSMYFSTRLSATDPSQADQQKMMAIMMPLMFAFMFAGFPSAFLLYWLLFNIMQTTHQVLILRDKGTKPVVESPAKS